MMSLRTRGISAKKKSANVPATAPKPAAVAPLFEGKEKSSLAYNKLL